MMKKNREADYLAKGRKEVLEVYSVEPKDLDGSLFVFVRTKGLRHPGGIAFFKGKDTDFGRLVAPNDRITVIHGGDGTSGELIKLRRPEKVGKRLRWKSIWRK